MRRWPAMSRFGGSALSDMASFRAGTGWEQDLGGEQSPWKERVFRRWQRRRDTTDSSVEQRLEVGCSALDDRFDRLVASAAWAARSEWPVASAIGRPLSQPLGAASGGPLRRLIADATAVWNLTAHASRRFGVGSAGQFYSNARRLRSVCRTGCGDVGVRLRTGASPDRRAIGNSMGARACSDAGTATDEGNPLKGVNRAAGKATRSPHLRVWRAGERPET